jgi:ribosomal protein S18 acetylase RimI-like enzyme
MPEKISKGKLVIREAKEKDLGLIERLAKEGVFEKGLASIVELDNIKVFVALHDGKIVGFCKSGERNILHSSRPKREGFIVRTEVAKGYKGGGIGRKLLGKTHAMFERRGIKQTRLVSVKPAEPFHLKAGYETELDRASIVKMRRISPNARRKRI